MDKMMENWRKILLVEDNPKDRELTILALEDVNLLNEIVAVSDGNEAIDYLFYKGKFETRDKGTPIVILLDIKMPKLSGIDVLKIIRSEEKLKHIPVVMLTSSREEKDLEACYQQGINAYVVKPVGFQEFVESVKNLGLFWGIVNVPPKDVQ